MMIATSDAAAREDRPVITPGEDHGFFTDTTLCIGCKACEVACKEWNALPSLVGDLSGHSYDNTGQLSATTWRHVLFAEDLDLRPGDGAMPPFQSHWRMMSDVCKHCSPAPCLEACPTGAIFRTEFDTVVVQQDICNGCGYCVPACPFGVVAVDETDGKAHKCTMCYDRLKGDLEPACSKACPTESIRFGRLDDLDRLAEARLAELQAAGVSEARLYGAPDGTETAGGIVRLNAFFLLTARPEAYNLPVRPTRPVRSIPGSLAFGIATVGALSAVAAISLHFLS
jgi:formate dehydrogenase iron-sulfur subunit